MEHVQLGRLITPAKLVRAGDRALPILSMTMHEGLVDQASKFKKRVASTDTAQYKVVNRDQLVVGFPIDEGVLSFQNLYDEAIVSPAYDIWDLRRDNRVDSRYLERFLRSPRALVFYASKLRGTTARRRSLPDDIFLSLVVPLPSLAEQRRVVEMLDRTDSLREKRRQVIAKLEALLKAIFIEMFGDPRTNPKGWGRKELSEVGTLDRGRSKHRPRNAPELLGGPYPLIQTGDIANAHGYIIKYTQTYSELGLKQSKIWTAGTLCITIAANIAKTAILTFDACFPDSVVGFTPNDLTTTEFVQYWLSFLQKTLEDTAPESAQKNINLKILNELNIPLPPKALQEKFSYIVKAVESVKSKSRESYTKADELFRSLQQRAFSGELFTEKDLSVPSFSEVSQHV